MKPTSEIEELIANETKRRLEEMESPNYVFCPSHFLKSDFTIVIVLVLINLILIILAMTGGIQ